MTSIDTGSIAAAKPARALRRSTKRGTVKPTTPLRKSAIVAKLLARPKGVTLAEVSTATGWQAHSVRAFFSGFRKKSVILMRDARQFGESCYRSMPSEITEGKPDAVTSTAASGSSVPTGGTVQLVATPSVARAWAPWTNS